MKAKRATLVPPESDAPVPFPAATDVADVGRLRAFVDALPYPASIYQWIDDELKPLATNALFKAFWSDRRTDEEFSTEQELDKWRSTARAVAQGVTPDVQFELKFRGVLGPCVYRCSLSRIAGAEPDNGLLLVTAMNRTDEFNRESVLRRELLTDTLTALPNRSGFIEQVEARHEQGSLGAIIVVDLMRFSRINESLGATSGDEIIITVARRIKSILRAGDLLARVGGNEFAIHSQSVTERKAAEQISDRIKAALESPIRIGTYLLNVEAAAGCAIRQSDAEHPEDLFRRAQAAVKQAKQTGHFEVYKPSALAAAQERFNLESKLREAIQEDQLHLAFQPFVSLPGEEIVGFEALARWHDPDLGDVSPVKFIPVAEESGLIVPLGRWALRESARQLAEWDRQYGEEVPLTINVNLSPVQIARDDVPDAVHDALDGAQINGHRFTIELTESALIADIAKTRKLLAALKAMDLTIAMDDFGTGYSNLANLQTLPIDVLKIDRSFVTGMVGDRDKVAIVRAILSLAGALGMRTVAEGIETAEVAKALGELGCSRGQGYYYARPLKADEAYAFWLSRRAPATS